jgi:hypothetical protein
MGGVETAGVWNLYMCACVHVSCCLVGTKFTVYSHNSVGIAFIWSTHWTLKAWCKFQLGIVCVDNGPWQDEIGEIVDTLQNKPSPAHTQSVGICCIHTHSPDDRYMEVCVCVCLLLYWRCIQLLEMYTMYSLSHEKRLAPEGLRCSLEQNVTTRRPDKGDFPFSL